MKNLLQQNRAELSRALRNFDYEKMGDGRILFPKSKLVGGGAFGHSVNGADYRLSGNMVVNQGLDDLLNVYWGNQAKRTNFYIAPFAANVTPTDALTAALFTSTQTEFTNYTESTRVAFQKPTSTTTQTISNTANPARFTIATGGGTIWGAAILTAQAKSATTGVLVCCALFEDDGVNDGKRDLKAGDKLDLEYIFTASDAS